jgi:hypothetical protein
VSFKKIERWPSSELRRAWPTVASMIEADWDIIAVCTTCHLATRVDLKVVRAVRGPEAVIWNQTAACKKVGCSGVVHFKGKHPKMDAHTVLTAPWPEGE